MPYDFTTLVSRKDTGSSKWNAMYRQNPNVPDGVIPLSVADMELKNPPQIAEGVGEYLKHTILGYTNPTQRFYDAIVSWQKRRNGWDIQPEWIVDYPGVVPAAISSARGRNPHVTEMHGSPAFLANATSTSESPT